MSVLAIMCATGIGIASWVTRTPAARDAIGASTAQMGMVLFGLSLGSMIGILSSGRAVAKIGTRPVIFAGSILVACGVGVIALGAGTSNMIVVFAGLALFGLGSGGADIALNIEGAELEGLLGRPVLPALHGFFSLGTVIGAFIGIGLTYISFPIAWHLAGVSVLILLVTLGVVRGIPRGVGIETATAEVSSGSKSPRQRSVWRDPALLLVGFVVLAMAFAEGSASDWLPLLMVDGHGVSATYGSVIYAGFAITMTIGRFAGGPFVEKFGRSSVLTVCAALAVVGVLTVTYAPSLIVAACAVALWGLGASLGFPVAISAAGDSTDRPAERVSAVATSGYLAFLVGPPLLGFVGEHLGLQQAMLVVVVLLILAGVCAYRMRKVS